MCQGDRHTIDTLLLLYMRYVSRLCTVFGGVLISLCPPPPPPPLQERNRAATLDKKQKQVDKQLNEWKFKCDEKEAELANSKKEAHISSTEVSYEVPDVVLSALTTPHRKPLRS